MGFATWVAMSDARWDARPHAGLLSAARRVVRAVGRVHPVHVEGVENIPEGGAILVGNHGLLGWETPFFVERISAELGRMPIGLADKWFFRVPGIRDLLVRIGGAYCSVKNGYEALRRGELVVCYPGGAREVMKSEKDKYRCLWDRSVGFVRLALMAGVPIVPFAAAGVDDTFDVLGRLHGTGKLLMNDSKYDLPLVWGWGPLPRPVPFWFRIGHAIHLPSGVRSTNVAAVLELHRWLWTHTQEMVDDLVARWRAVNGRSMPALRWRTA
jgi:1-acyl-sn-glycerol-3-phosphate acyltransferase